MRETKIDSLKASMGRKINFQRVETKSHLLILEKKSTFNFAPICFISPMTIEILFV
jgi:hypothetical protein